MQVNALKTVADYYTMAHTKLTMELWDGKNEIKQVENPMYLGIIMDTNVR
jgi:hypothetical protein